MARGLEEMFADTIMGMKKAILRKSEDSESDSSTGKPTNRGNKLKRKARYTQQGRLDNGNAVLAHRRKINYNGYYREIISKNPLRVDVDGDVVDDDGEDTNEKLEDVREDPYKAIRIENVLMPLTSAAALKDHPTLSLPYTSRAIEDMLQQAQEMVQREEKALASMKRLFEQFHGDSSWMPVELFESPNDVILLAESAANGSSASSPPHLQQINDENAIDSADWVEAHRPSVAGEDGKEETATKVEAQAQNGMTLESDKENGIDAVAEPGASNATDTIPNSQPTLTEALNSAAEAHNSTAVAPNQTTKEYDPDETMEMEEDEPPDQDDEALLPAHRMTTRAKARDASPTSATSRATTPDTIHPFYLVDPATYSSSNCGLPPYAADETRRVLSSYVQKQTDIVQSCWKLYKGLLEARRMREEVLEWCTAEGHVGECSDGEDWVDLDRWGLAEGELLKGKEEEEEDLLQTAGKKTRNRRAAGGERQ